MLVRVDSVLPLPAGSRAELEGLAVPHRAARDLASQCSALRRVEHCSGRRIARAWDHEGAGRSPLCASGHCRRLPEIRHNGWLWAPCDVSFVPRDGGEGTMRDHRRAAAVFAATAGIAAFAAQPAAAAPEWNDGLPEDHFTQTCESIGGVGGYREEHSSQVKAGTFVDHRTFRRSGRSFTPAWRWPRSGAAGRSRSSRRSSRRSASRSRSRPRIPCAVTTRSRTAPIRRSAAVRRSCSPDLMEGSRSHRTATPTMPGPASGRLREHRP